jgi:hypothetical protein
MAGLSWRPQILSVRLAALSRPKASFSCVAIPSYDHFIREFIHREFGDLPLWFLHFFPATNKSRPLFSILSRFLRIFPGPNPLFRDLQSAHMGAGRLRQWDVEIWMAGGARARHFLTGL